MNKVLLRTVCSICLAVALFSSLSINAKPAFSDLSGNVVKAVNDATFHKIDIVKGNISLDPDRGNHFLPVQKKSGKNFSPFAGPTLIDTANSPTQASFVTPTTSNSAPIQKFIVPYGVHEIVLKAVGGAGGYVGSIPGGRGASLSRRYPVTPGDELFIIVGGMGSNMVGGGPGGGGGGGTFVYHIVSGNPVLLIAAGGGGGAGNETVYDNYSDYTGDPQDQQIDANIGTSFISSSNSYYDMRNGYYGLQSPDTGGGGNGAPGHSYTQPGENSYDPLLGNLNAGGGAGWGVTPSDDPDFLYTGDFHGKSPQDAGGAQGGVSGFGSTYGSQGDGGYGGGGATYNNGGGGGGGYTGGGGGANDMDMSLSTHGGGGGSYVAPEGTVITHPNFTDTWGSYGADGYVKIEWDVFEINVIGTPSNLSVLTGDITPSATDGTDFGSTTVGTPVTHSFNVQNLGHVGTAGTTYMGVLTTSGTITLSGSGASSFSIVTQPASSINPSAASPFSVVFSPTSSGTKTATITIPNNDYNENPYIFSIQGTATSASTPLSPGAIGTNQAICSGSTPAAFTSTTLASGGTGTISYQWQSATDGVNFTNISGATSSAYAPGSLTQTTYYRRGAYTSTDATVYTSSVKITVNALPVVTASSNSPVTVGGTLNLTSSSATAVSYGWSGPSFTSTLQNPSLGGVNSGNAGTYTVTATDANNCNASASTVVVIRTPATALNFDGVDDKVTVNNNTLANFGTGDFTVEMSVRTTLTSGVEYLASKRGNCGPDNFFSLQIVNGKLNMEMAEPANYVALVGHTTISDGNWHHVALTRQLGNVNIYVDGVLETTSNATIANINNSYYLEFGSSVCNGGGGGNGSVKFKGDMDEIRIWSRALCTAELDHYRHCELTLPQTGLQAYYKLNSGFINADNSAYTTATDETGANNATLSLSPNGFGLTGTTSNWVAGTVSGTCTPYTTAAQAITGTPSVCVGSTTQLSNPSTGGTWTSGNTNVATVNLTSGVVTGVSAGTVTITYTSLCGAVSTITVTVTALDTITITSGFGTDKQTVCTNTALTNITYNTTGATGATFSGLPAGVTGTWVSTGGVNGTVTISGAPTASSGYTVTLTGGCPGATATGTITATPNNTITLTSAAGTDAQSKCVLSPLTTITYATTGATGATFSGLPLGVSGSWSGNVVTISGTATVPGTYNYTVTLTGGCGTVTANGTITIAIANAAVLTSGLGSDGQKTCANTAIDNITYTTIGATGATFSGLPTGVTGVWSSNVVTISGTPTVSGTFSYIVALRGGCGTVSASGSITVNPLPSANISGTATVCQNGATPAIVFTGSNGSSPYTFTYTINGVTQPTVNGSNSATVYASTTTSGTFTYALVSVKDASSSACSASVSGSAVVTVTPSNTITLTSAAGTDAQSDCTGTAITNITYSTTGATGATFSNLPAGVTGTWSGNVVTISGTPTATGTYNYTVTLTGGCPGATASGTIKVNAAPVITSVSGSGSTICAGSTVTLQAFIASGGANYYWYDAPTGGNLVSSPDYTFVTPALTASIIYYVAASANGCTSARTAVPITVNPMVTPTFAQVAAICSGGSLSALPTTSTNGITGTWSPALNNTATTTYTFTPSAGQCASTATMTITVNPLPNLYTVSGSTIVCENGGAAITTNGSQTGINYQLTGYLTSGGTVSGGQNGTGSGLYFSAPASNGTYTLIGTNITTGCSLTMTGNPMITVTPLPTISGTTNVCAGSTRTLTGSGTTASWSSSNSSIATVNNSGVVTGVAAGTVTIYYSNTAGCTNSVSFTVYASPAAPVSGGDQSACSPSGVTLSATPGSGETIDWYTTATGGMPLSVGTTTQSANSSVTLYAEARNTTTGCVSATRTAVTATINPLPIVSITRAGPTALCYGGSVVLNAAPSGAGYTYQWLLNNNPIGGATGSSYTATQAGTYSVTVTNTATTCSATGGGITVSVGLQPHISSGITTVCSGSSVGLLTDLVATGTTFQWQKDGVNIPMANSSTTVTNADGTFVQSSYNATASGSYTVVETDANGCAATSNAIVATVNPLPATPTISGNSSYCAGGSVVLTSSPASGYLWSNGRNTQSVTVGAGTYTVTISDANNCQSTSAPFTVTENPLPTINGASQVCTGSNITLSSTDAPATSNAWVSSDPSKATVSSTGVVSGLAQGVVSITYTNSNGCSSSVFITVNGLPTVLINGNTTFCAGSSSVLTANTQGGLTYVWSPNGETSSSITVTTGGTYGLIATNPSTGCSGSASVVVTVNALPATPTISGNSAYCAGGSVVLTSSSATGNMWSNGPNTQSVTVGAGTYTVTVTNANNCKATSAPFTVTANPLPGATISSSATAICKGSTSGTVTFTGTTGTAPFTFSYQVNSGSIQTVTTTSGNSVSIPVSTTNNGTFVYSLVSVKDASSTTCTASASGSVIVSVSSPSASIGTLSAVCQNATNINEILTASGGTRPYIFTYTINGGAQQTATTPSGKDTVHLPVATGMAGSSVYQLVSVQEGSSIACVTAVSGSSTVVINALPNASIAVNGVTNGSTGTCINSSSPVITFTGSNGVAPYTITYKINGGSNQTITTSGNTATVSVSTAAAGTFAYTLVSVQDASSSACINGAGGGVSVTVNPTPATPTIAVVDNCDGTSTLTAGNIASGAGYHWSTGVNNTPVITVNAAGTYTLQQAVNNCPSAIASATASPKTTPTASITASGATSVCPGNKVTLTANTGAGYTYQWYKDGVAIASGTDVNYDATVSGSYTVVITSNGCASPASNAIAVTIADTTPPVVPTLADVTDECAATAPVVTTTDNCSGTITGTTTDSRTYNTQGTHVIHWTFTDASGNVSTATQNVIIHDVTPPSINCPGNITTHATATTDGYGAYVNYTVTASDNCGTVTLSYSKNSGTLFPVGTTTVTATADDGNGHTATCHFDVIVIAPEINITGNNVDIVKGDNTPSATDDTYFGSTLPATPIVKTFTIQNQGNDNLNITGIAISGMDAASFTLAPFTPTVLAPGATTTFTITFQAGTVGTKTATVTVANNDFDESSYDFAISADINCSTPVFSACPSPITQNTDAGLCSAVVSYTTTVSGIPAPGLTYTLSGATTGSDTGDGSGSVFNKGTTTVTVTATNSCGSATCSFTVTVVDNEFPVIHNTPTNISKSNDAGQCGAVVTWTLPTATDNCPGVTLTSDHHSGDQFPVGTTTVTYTSTDGAGHTVTTSFTITVTDDENPIVITPSDVTHTADPGKCSYTFTLNDNSNSQTQTPNGGPSNGPVTPALLNVATATDNCGVVTVIGVRSDAQPLDAAYPVGTTTITWTATDSHGHSVNGTSTVIITDNEKPSITAPAAVSVNADNGKCEATNVTLGTPATGDNCEVKSVINDAPSSFPIGTTTVTWTVTDIHGNTNTATQLVTVTDNQPPVIACHTNITVYGTAGLNGANVDYTVTATDNCGTPVVTYDVQPKSFFPMGTTAVTVTATDANGLTSTCTFTVTVLNNVPVANPDTNTTPEDTTVSGNVLPNDTDLDGNTLTVTSFVINGTTYTPGTTVNLTEGTIVLNANGSYTYTPALNYNGSVPVVTYSITDGQGGTASSTLTINVTPVNDAPVANPDTNTIPEDTQATGNVLTNDTDVDGDALSVTTFVINGNTYTAGTTATIPSVGTLVINANGTYTFTPVANYNGNVPVVTYSITDGNGGTASSTLTIVVTPVNDAPVANPDTNTIPEDTQATGNVLSNDTDVDGDALSVTTFVINGNTYTAGTTATIPSVGTLVINANGTYTFTPVANYNGNVPVVTYSITDGNGGTASSTLTIVVTPVNDAPVANPDTNTIPEDTQATGNVLTNDTDVDGDALSVTTFVINGNTYTAGTTATIPSVGTLVINANGTYTFTPVANYNGNVPVVTYSITDGNGGTASSTLTIVVTPVNDAPVANPDTNTIPEDTQATGNVLSNDADVDGDALNVTTFVINGTTYTAGTTATIPSVGTLVINANGTYTFTPVANYNGNVPVVTYSITDGNGGTASSTLTIIVTPVNDPPVANPDTNNIDEDTPAIGNVITNDTDVDGDVLTVTSFVINGTTYTVGTTATIPGVGTLVINTNGGYVFTPAPNYNGAVPVVTYYITDGNGGSARSTLTITINPVNDPPVIRTRNIIIYVDSTGHVSITPPQIDNGSTDPDGIASITLDKTSFDCSNIATSPNIVTLKVTDVNGDFGTATATVTVLDAIAPIIVCPAPVTVQCASAVPAPDVASATATDNCSAVISYVGDVISNQTAPNKYTITRTYKATDPSGNFSTCTQIITVNDNTAPTLIVAGSLPGNASGQCLSDVPGAPSTASIAALYTDNCSGTITAVLNNTTTTGTNATGWVRKYFYTITDASGNSTSACITYSGKDTQAPVPTVASLPTITGECSASVTAPTAEDNCAGTITATTPDATSYNAQGTYTVHWTYSDNNGNTTSQTQTVIVKDDIAPVITCPGDITVTASSLLNSIAGATVNYTATATDNCGVAVVTYSIAPGSFFATGSTLVTATANDGHGNTASCSFHVIVNCVTPVFTTCPSNKSVNTDAGLCSAVVTYTSAATGTPTASCNYTFSGATTGSGTGNGSGKVFNKGTTTVTITAANLCGSATCSFTVTVADNENPVMAGLPTNISKTTDAGKCGAVVTWTAPTATDNCPGVTLVSNHASGELFPTGTTTVTYTATDASGHAVSGSFTVTVADTEKPTFTCPSDINVTATTTVGNVTGSNITYAATNQADNCGVLSTTYSIVPGSFFATGTTPVTVTVTDINGNKSTCTFNVTVNCVTPVFTTCPSNKSVNTDAGLCSAVVTYTSAATGTPTASCNYAFSGATTGSGTGNGSGKVFNKGTTTVTITAANLCGSATCSFTVTVSDNENPVIAGLPTNISKTTDAGKCGAVVTWTAPTATDNCPGVTLVSNHASGELLPTGTTTVTYTATDASGHALSGSFTVTVADTEKPTFTCPSDINVTATTTVGSVTGSNITYAATNQADNCGVLSTTYSIVPGSFFATGTTPVTVTVTDINGNKSTCTFNVTVNCVTPVFTTCPSNKSVNTDAGLCSAVVTYTSAATGTPTASCNYAFSGATTGSGTGNGSGKVFNKGTTTVTITAANLCGSATCSFTVTVADNENPVIAGLPTNISKTTDAGKCGAVVTWTAPTAADNCPGVTLVSNHASGELFPTGTTTVTYTATDASGHAVSGSFTVTVADTEKPTFTCPSDINVTATTTVGSVTGSNITYAATNQADNCGVLSTTYSIVPGSFFATGTTPVTVTVTDINGNKSTCTFNVTVNCVTPVFTTCPSNITQSTDAGKCSAVVTYTSAATGTPTSSCNYTFSGATTGSGTGNGSGKVFNKGITTVTITAANLCGSAICSFTVTVNDTEKPTITAPVAYNVANDPGKCGATIANIGTPVTNDNCGVLSVTNNHPANNFYPVGKTIVTWIVTDVNGNVTDTAKQCITVMDNEMPTISVSNISANNTPGLCSATVTLPAPTTGDNCGVASVTNNHPSTTFPVGVTTVTWTVTDNAGWKTTATQTVTVVDNEKPTFTCPSNITVTANTSVNGQSGSSMVTYGVTDQHDNCGVQSTTYSIVPGSFFATGTTPVTVTVTDVNGNKSTCTFTVTVGCVAPVITCSPNISANTTATACSAPVTYSTTATGTGTVTLSYVLSGATTGSGSGDGHGSIFNKGVTTVTITATNLCGSSSKSFTVTVTDNVAPVPTIASLPTVTGSCSVSVTAPTATDNCAGTVTATTLNPTSYTAAGTYTITWTYSDGNGNSSSQTQVVVVKTQGPPVPTVATLPDITGQCSVTVSTKPTAKALCTNAVITATTTDGLCYTTQGTYVIHWTYTDSYGNKTLQTQNVIVKDNIAPVPTVATLPTITGQCSASLVINTPNCSDDCYCCRNGCNCHSGCSCSYNNYNNWYYSYYNRNCDYWDNHDCDYDCDDHSNGSCSPNVTAPTAVDNCKGTITGTTTDALSYSSQGTYTIHWKFDDGNGNVTIQNQTVIVDDQIAPVPNVSTLSTIYGTCSVTVTSRPTAKDNCAGTITGTTTDPLSYTGVGTYTIHWKYDDGNGNVATQNQTVIISDNVKPVLTEPNDITVSCGSSLLPSVTGNATATDNCGTPVITYTDVTSGNKITRTWKATDAAGNYDVDVQIITIIDNVKPVVTAPNDVTISCGSSTAPSATGGNATATDNCGGTVAITYTDVTASGKITRTWKGTDAAGNYNTDVQVINIVDNVKPVLTVPSNITVSCGSSTTPSGCNSNATATDNCSTPTVTYSDVTSGNVITRTWKATDASGNYTTGVQTITVIDNVKPVITDVHDITISCGTSTTPSGCGSVATATDNCSTPTVTYSDVTSGNTITRTWKATDAAGNYATSTQIITIIDNTKPVLTEPNDITISCGSSLLPAATGNATATDACSTPVITYTDVTSGNKITRTWKATDAAGNYDTDIQIITIADNTKPVISTPANATVSCATSTAPAATGTATATDACSTPTVTYSDVTSGNVITRTWKATDAAGNYITGTQTITVVDNVKPVLTVPSNITVSCGSSTTPSGCNSNATATDACSTPTVTYSDVTSGNVITRTWKATDASGNYTTGVQTITVIDNVKPVITDVHDITISCGTSTTPSGCGSVATATDNCSTPTVTYSDVTSGNTITRTWKATDAAGNYATSIQIITIIDNTKPVISDVADKTVNCGTSTLPATTGTATATDACSTPTVTYSDVTSGNTITRTWKATDASGNYSTSTQIITVGSAFTASITSVPTSSTYTGGVSTNLYLGYGAQSTTLSMCSLPSSGAPYTYVWSGSYTSKLNSTTSAAPVFTPATFGYYTFSVTVTNKYGCTSVASISICVTDIRVAGTNGAKVYVCHTTAGKYGTSQTLQVTPSQVPSHIETNNTCGGNGSDRLGSCDQSPCNTTVSNSVVSNTSGMTKEGSEQVVTSEEELKVTVMPNPTTTFFTLKIESKYETPVNMRVMDAQGRVIDAKSKIGANSTIQIGHNYSSGTYYAEMTQGNTRKVVQMIKGRG